jgi:hypothetical protein
VRLKNSSARKAALALVESAALAADRAHGFCARFVKARNPKHRREEPVRAERSQREPFYPGQRDHILRPALWQKRLAKFPFGEAAIFAAIRFAVRQFF